MNFRNLKVTRVESDGPDGKEFVTLHLQGQQGLNPENRFVTATVRMPIEMIPQGEALGVSDRKQLTVGTDTAPAPTREPAS